MQAIPQPWERGLATGLFSTDAEKSFTDKVLDKSGVERVKELMRKPKLDRDDLLELLYMLSAVEAKLVNFDPWDRYLLGKFYAWIRDFVASAELLYDLEEEIGKKNIEVNDNTEKMLEKIKNMMSHNIKFLADVYFYLSRSTLSLGATGFDTLTKSRFEYFYPGQHQAQPQQETRKSAFNIFK